MNSSLFMTLLTILTVVVTILTEAVKKFFEGTNFKYSSNIAVLIVSLVVGVGGTALTYISLSIAFTPPNIVCMFLMALAVWVSSMVGYDKVIQTMEQFKDIKK